MLVMYIENNLRWTCVYIDLSPMLVLDLMVVPEKRKRLLKIIFLTESVKYKINILKLKTIVIINDRVKKEHLNKKKKKNNTKQ